MSFKALSWAATQRLKCHEKLVLMMLANRADPESNSCFPTMSTLAQDCGLSVSQVRKTVANLEKLGLVSRTGQIRTYGQSSNIFTLTGMGTPTPIECPPTPMERHKLFPLNRRTQSTQFRAKVGKVRVRL